MHQFFYPYSFATEKMVVRLLLLLSPVNSSTTDNSCVRRKLRRNRPTRSFSSVDSDMHNNILRVSFKVWNFAMGLAGIATILYSVLVFRVSDQAGDGEASSSHQISIPWFFHAFLFVGIVVCAVTCLGHMAAETANACFLSTYIVSILLLLILETVIMTDAFLNSKSEKELPVFSDSNDSVVSSDYIGKCLASIDFIIQAICVLLAALSVRDHNADYVDDSESDEDEEDEDNEQSSLGPYSPFARWQLSERYVV